MSVTPVGMFLWFYAVVATGNAKSARQIEANKIFWKNGRYGKLCFSFLLLFQT